MTVLAWFTIQMNWSSNTSLEPSTISVKQLNSLYFLNIKGARRFQFSDLPEPKSNAGRPRKEINKQLPLFNDNNNMEQK